MTWHTVVILEIEQHVRICTFVDIISIIDLLEPRQTTGNHQLVTTLSDADLSPTPQDVVVRPVDPSLQFAIVKNVYSGI